MTVREMVDVPRRYLAWPRTALARKIRGVFRFRYRHKSPRVVQVQY